MVLGVCTLGEVPGGALQLAGTPSGPGHRRRQVWQGEVL